MVEVKGALPVKKAALKTHARTTKAEDTPEAKATIPAKQKAAEDQFAKADAAAADGDGDMKLRMAALGGI